MAVNHTGNNAPHTTLDEAVQGVHGSQGQGFNYQSQAQPQAQQSQAHEWTQLEDLFDVHVNTAAGSEILVKAASVIEEQLREITEPVSKAITMDFIQLDRESNVRLTHSLLVVAFSITARPELGASYHTLIIEASTPEDDIRYENIMGQNVEVRRLVSDAYDTRMRTEIQRAVEQRVVAQKLVSAEASTLPRNFNLDDALAVRNLAGNILIAVRNTLQMSGRGWNDLNIAKLGGSAGLNSSVKFNRNGEQVRDNAGLPVRSDVVIDLQTKEIRNSQELVRSKSIAKISGYVDLVYAPSNQAMNPYGVQQRGPSYLPRFIITNLDSTSARSIGGQLLALLSSLALYPNNTALASLYPNTSVRKDTPDMHDIGNLNWEANITNAETGGFYLDLKGANITPEEISSYLATLLHPTFELAMDVSNCGADTWLNEVFAGAAAGLPDDYRRIVAAANQLTGGAFSKYFKEGTPIARYESELPMGYYVDHNGVSRDIRDVDYLAVLGVCGGKSLEPLFNWTNAKGNPQMENNIRLAEQRRMTETIVPGEVHYTGYASRLVFHPEFLVALSSSAQEAGLRLSTQVPNSGQTQQRYVYQTPTDFSSNQIAGSLFVHPYANNQSYGNQGQQRWYR